MEAKQQGFTLLELLVVLALVAMIVTLFLDPIARVYDLKSRLTAFIGGAPQKILPPSWFQASVKGIYVGEDKFEGTTQHFGGETSASFDEPQGVPMPFAWDIAYDGDKDQSSLTYINAVDEEMVVLEWPGESGGFSYFDPEKEEWLEEWQSSPFMKKDEYRLPSLIRFEATREGSPLIMLASLETSRDYRKNLKSEIDRMIEKLGKQAQERGIDIGLEKDVQDRNPFAKEKKRIKKKKNKSAAGEGDLDVFNGSADAATDDRDALIRDILG